jgi:DNA-binding CsgD family transcriptional regulator
LIRNDEQYLSIIDAFQSAAVGAQSWETAMQSFADITGSRSGQLTGFDSNASVLFNVFTNIDPAAYKVFAATTEINPRVPVIQDAPTLKVISDSDFMTPRECDRHPFYQEFLRPFDIPFTCMAILDRHEESFISLGILRSQRQGFITDEQRRTFAALAPHVRTAVRTHRALRGHGIAVLTGALEALSIPAFICDRRGNVKALTQSAEILVTSGRGLELKAGRLQPDRPDDAKVLDDALGATVAGQRPGPPLLRTVIVRSRNSGPPLVLDVFPLPHQPYQLNFEPRALVVARGITSSPARRATLLQTLYELTLSEADIAQGIAEGGSAETIATRRDVSIGTVRAQIKAIMAKVGVNRQAELVALISHL